MTPAQRIAHLVVGPTAAGKSTFARALAAETQAVRFAIDEWMHALFSADMPQTLDMAWAMTRVARCQAQVWSVARQILATGTDVVLELGLLRKTDRDAFSRPPDTPHVFISSMRIWHCAGNACCKETRRRVRPIRST